MAEPLLEEIKEELEENIDNKILSIEASNLLQIQYKIRKMRKEALEGFSDTMKECKSVCKQYRDIIGDLNGTGGQKNNQR